MHDDTAPVCHPGSPRTYPYCQVFGFFDGHAVDGVDSCQGVVFLPVAAPIIVVPVVGVGHAYGAGDGVAGAEAEAYDRTFRDE